MSSRPTPSTNTIPRFRNGAEPPGCQPRCGHPSLKTSPWHLSVPGLQLETPKQDRAALRGLHRRSAPRSRPVTTKSRAPGGPLTVRAPASRTGAAGASGPVSEVGDQPLQRCPGTRIRPPRPPPGLTAPVASCSSAGRRVRPTPPRPPGSAAASRA